MLLRRVLPWSFVRLLIAIAASAAALFLIWTSFGKEERLQARADTELLNGSPTAARRQAETILSSAPLSAAVLRTAGFAAEREGDLQAAGELMGFAAGLGWRDTPTQLWLLRSSLFQGDLASAALHTDALARRDVDRMKMIRLMQAMVEHDQGRQAVALALARRPNWRPEFFSAEGLRDVSVIAPLLAALRKEGAPVEPAELGGLVNQRIKAGQYAEARQLWSAFSKIGEAAAGASVVDGSFDWAGEAGRRHATRTPFEWRLWNAAGTLVAISAPPAAPSDPALMILSRGSETAVIASQTLLLRPGGHSLRFRVLSERGPASDALYQWRLKCLPEPASHLSFTETGHVKAGQWDEYRLEVTVPDDRCRAQRLELEYLSSPGVSENRVWIDDVRVEARRPSPN